MYILYFESFVSFIISDIQSYHRMSIDVFLVVFFLTSSETGPDHQPRSSVLHQVSGDKPAAVPGVPGEQIQPTRSPTPLVRSASRPPQDHSVEVLQIPHQAGYL